MHWKWRRMAAALLMVIIGMSGGAARAGSLSAASMEERAPFEMNCASALLVEPDSGQIVFEKNADEKRAVASVTKIMSILLTVEAIENGRIALTDQVVISANAAGMGGSQVLLDAGETQTVDILLKSMIVGSANDATVALAEHIAGSVQVFVDRMNQRASELGMENTHFVNTTGLPAEGHYTTARDVARMAIELAGHELYYRYSTIWLDEVVHESGRSTSLTNTNRLIRLYEGCDGIKTGSTNEAGYCMAATAKRGEMRLIAVVLGADTGKERFNIASEMLDYGFANYRRYPVTEKGARVRGGLPVTGGSSDEVPLMIAEDLTLLLKRGEEEKVKLQANLPEAAAAPINAGDAIGYVDVLLGERVVGQVRVVAAESVGRQSFRDGFLKMLRNWCFQ